MKPTMQLRAMKRTLWISDDQAINYYVIQQLWEGRDGEDVWTEWRDLPVVNEYENPDSWPS